MKILIQSLVVLSLFSLSTLVRADDVEDVQHCLKNWGTHPFSEEAPKFRVIASQVKVMGIGGEVTDTKITDTPELILLKPAVNVMSYNVISLLNPNGWYCLKGKVDVLGKTSIDVNCTAHLTGSNDGATVLGSNEADTGVTVLGKSEVNRVGCKAKASSEEPKAVEVE